MEALLVACNCTFGDSGLRPCQHEQDTCHDYSLVQLCAQTSIRSNPVAILSSAVAAKSGGCLWCMLEASHSCQLAMGVPSIGTTSGSTIGTKMSQQIAAS